MRVTPLILSSVTVLGALAVMASSHSQCGLGGWASACSVDNTGTSVEIGATTTPGGGGSSPSRPTPAPTLTLPPSMQDCGPLGCRPTYSVAVIPDVTIDDLAAFRPAAPRLTGEPAGFAVVGLPTNLVAAASEHQITGELLGWDVTVRFVPVGFVFDHGDGTTATTSSGGTPWATAGQPQFTPTATAHVYRERGERTARATVRYAASVDFGTGSWRPVPGFVTATSAGYAVRVVEATTALVDRTCGEGPRGPGC